MLLLAKNNIGWKNLIKINNVACDNFYKKPIISYDDLIKYT
jgi:DNA polymerase III alpha subunit